MKNTVTRLLILALTFGGLAWAEPDEPGRGVARLSLMNGDVSVRRGDSGDWVAAVVNAPLVVEDSVLTGVNSRAEVQFDWANMIRLASNTEIRLAELENQRYIVQVARGMVTFRVLRDFDADIEISTPSVSVRPVKQGTYRVEVLANGESEITVRSGEAEIFTPRGSERLRAGRTMLARGSASDPEYKIVAAAGRDDWDRWNEDRDRFFQRTASYRYVDRSVYGADDLDAYGTWVYVPPYGWVWSPRVVAGWAPYYYGRWTWIDWYGWTWVSYDPWGWAPYHYGRWFYHGPYGWCWWPGGVRVRHYWSPALVAFVGWGGWSGFSVGVGVGRIGWIPLAPYETYYPWYGRHVYRGYRNTTIIDNSVHIVNNTNIVNIYKNARVANAITAVDASNFGRGHGNLIRISGDHIRQADLVRGPVPIAPRRESLRMTDRDVSVRPVSSAATERFFTRRPPAKVERVTFEEQQRAMEQVTRRVAREPNALRGAEQGQAGGGGTTLGRENAARPGNSSGSAPSGGWRRVGEARPTEGTPAENRDGWRRVGESRPAEPTQRENREGFRRMGETQPNEAGSTENRDAWRRFGAGASRTEAGAAGPAPVQAAPQAPPTAPTVRRIPADRTPTSDSTGWRRFEGSSGTAQPSRVERTEPRRVERQEVVPSRPMRTDVPRYEAPSTPRYEAPSAPRTERNAPIRISPPIVRQREASPAPAPRVAEPRGPVVRQSPGGGFGTPRAEPGGGGGRASRANEGSARTRTR